MSHSPIEFLRHVLDEIDFLSSATNGLTKEHLLNDPTLKRAVVRSFEIIGEATRNLPVTFRDKHPEVNWKAMAAMRNRLIHGYISVDYDIVWNAIQDDVPLLREQIQQLIKEATL